jgi:EAL domain-containing protein (putative c-di-GMP-specific phosphodiesterase class I)
VRSTIDLGHNFGVKVVAEGVETSDSWQTLTELGCDLAQGYLISRPLAVDQVITTVSGINASLITAHTATQQVRAFRREPVIKTG